MSDYAEKILVLGVDGMDPRFTKYMVDSGKLPNVKKFIEKGSTRKDLAMLGGTPTITPPMWTTLATGASPNVHGISDFWNQHPTKLDVITYALDSTKCKAEQVWNIFAESGKKTLVWHWPGSSWPPTSDSSNLHVVEGSQPPSIHHGIAVVDDEIMVSASIEEDSTVYIAGNPAAAGAGCVIEGMKIEKPQKASERAQMSIDGAELSHYLFSHYDGEAATEMEERLSRYTTPLKKPVNWENVPEDAKEFSLITVKGIRRNPCLILKNEYGVYDRVAIFKNKKVKEPLIIIHKDKFVYDYIDEFEVEGVQKQALRAINIFELAPDGSKVVLWLSEAMDINVPPALWSPQELYRDVIEHVGYVPAIATCTGNGREYMEKRVLPLWDNYSQWQAKALNYMIESKNYEVVFSHLHNIDMIGHICWRWAKYRNELENDAEMYKGFLEEIYLQTDRYLGNFLHYLDEGWTIFIVSDHGLICGEEDEIPLLGEAFGVNIGVMQDLGYTVMQRDEDGDIVRVIDWEKTKALAPRGSHIYINLKGRNPNGIVDPKDKYDLERQIISDLYDYRIDGKRVVSLAVRNKDAAVFGMSGEGNGDIIYFLDEGFNRIHGDSLATFEGYFNTSVAPIFIAAGKGIKKGFTTERVIREMDFAPTVASVAGIRMPAQCEGAPVYQILDVE